MGTGQRWGDIHVWSPEELREEDIYLGEMIRFAREYTEYSHERRPDELPKGTHRLEMCSMQEARGGWETRELPYYEVDSYLSRVRGVEFHPSNMPTRSAWGEEWFELVPEFHNKMDPFAVAVDFEGKRIGYLKASIAARFQWIVRAKNADGYRCFLPGFIESFYSAWISLPTAQTWESRFNLDTYYRIIRNLWDLLPKDFLEIEVKKIVEHPSEKAAKELWKFRDSASQFFPAESDASHFSIVWHQVFQEIRRDYWNAEHEKYVLQRNEENQRIASLYKSGLTQAAVARELEISTTRVRAGLVELNVEIEADRAWNNPKTQERNKRIVELYESGLSQLRVAAEVGVSEQTVSRILKKNGVPIRRPIYSGIADNERTKRNREIVERYIAGESQHSLARAFGLDRTTIRSVLRKARVHIRHTVFAREKQESEAVKDLESLPTLAEKIIGKEAANSRHFEQYYAKSILALQQKEAGANDDSLAELFEVPIEKIKQMLADGVFYQDPTQDNERLNLAKQAAVEHWSKNQAKEMGTDFVRAVTDRKILRHFHPEILQG